MHYESRNRGVGAQSATSAAAKTTRKSGPTGQIRFAGTTADVVALIQPEHPLYIIRPEKLAQTAQKFLACFSGEVMYAVKCNPDKTVLQTLYKNGVKSFDVASIEEVRLARRVAPKAKLYFMHPVKSAESIREAYFSHGVRAFVLDTQEELFKIIRETELATDLELFVRLGLPKNGAAAIDFSPKFGAKPEDTSILLQQARAVASRLGLCFHVGTQTTDPGVYGRAIGLAAAVIEHSNVRIDALDIGGGFPVPYPGETIPPLEQFMKTIAEALSDAGLESIPLLCEPGRALVAESGSLVVRVEQRRGDTLYLNDGTYGGLFDAAALLNTRFPVQAIRRNNGKKKRAAKTVDFSFAGPTCDSLDMMPGPFSLPADMATGDWIEIGNTGAYSATLRSNFNGFGKAGTVALYDPPEESCMIERHTTQTKGSTQ